MKESIKNIVAVAASLLLRPMALFPMKKYKVALSAYSGQSYTCSPKSIYLAMKERYPNRFTFVWGFKNPEEWSTLSANDTVVCKYRSLAWYFHRMTSKFYITNAIEGTEIPKRRKQIRIQTWHGGGCYKRVIQAESEADSALRRRELKNTSTVDCFLSSSRFFSERVIPEDFSYTGRIFEVGLPRNDMLVKRDDQYVSIRSKVRKNLGIQDEIVLIYAPTWRYDRNVDFSTIDFGPVRKAIKERFGKGCVVLYRAHVNMVLPVGSGGNERDVSTYPDMQELLAAADILVTDYSSCVWDFSLTEKPTFLFVPDLSDYESERDFWRPIRSWGFPVCETVDELASSIATADWGQLRKSVVEHLESLGSFEEGNAANSVADYIMSEVES